MQYKIISRKKEEHEGQQLGTKLASNILSTFVYSSTFSLLCNDKQQQQQ